MVKIEEGGGRELGEQRLKDGRVRCDYRFQEAESIVLGASIADWEGIRVPEKVGLAELLAAHAAVEGVREMEPISEGAPF